MQTKRTGETPIDQTAKPFRYPGPDSFRDDVADSRIFFGRDEEVAEVFNRLLSSKLLVLYAKSGLGKTSLLQAGLFPKLRASNLLPLRLRFNHRDKDALEELKLAADKACREQQVAYTAGKGDTFWEFFNTALFSKGEQFLSPVLVLDQFEEIFTLQEEKYRRNLGQQLGYLVSGQTPDSVRERIRKGIKPDYPSTPPNVRLLMSLREDSVGALQEMAEFIPGILSQRFRLTPLDRPRARQAIVAPAKLTDSGIDYRSLPFSYQSQTDEYPDTVNAILDHLQDKRGNIEPFQLQLLCRHIELKVIAAQTQSKEPVIVDLQSYLGGKEGMDAVIKRFYQNAIAALPGWNARRKARTLCETGLLNPEGRRESLSLSQIRQHYGLNNKVLNLLVNQKVLRREERLDSFAYELSHDSLASTVFKTRRSTLRRKWLAITTLLCLSIAGIAVWQWQGKVSEGQRASINLSEYKQQVQELVALDRLGARTIKEPSMVHIPPGRFQMGSQDGDKYERPVHSVTVKGFSLGVYEVTFEEYDQFAATTEGYDLPDDRGWGRGKRPVMNVNWEDANAYAAWLSEKTGKKYRLPTEAEWEYAARAGTQTVYWWGNDIGRNNANCNDCGSDAPWDNKSTAPVGSYKANPFGLYDTAGNVWEWVQDCWHENYQSAPLDGSAWEKQADGDCSQRVLRGGSWGVDARYLRSATRFRSYAGYRVSIIGFRLAQD